jgi:hypothetical protein
MANCSVVRLRFIVCAAVLALSLPALAAAQAVGTQLAATEMFDPLDLFGGGPTGAIISPGTLTCPGTQPTGNPMQPCPPGSQIRVRDAAAKTRVMSESALLAGWMFLQANFDFDANESGHGWGTLRIELDAGGVWEASWTSDRSRVGNANVWIERIISSFGRGIGGIVDGMHLRLTETAIGSTVAYAGAIDAKVLVPPSR